MNKTLAVAALGAVLSGTLASGPAHAAGRDYIYIAGSSTVYPFTTVVAEQFGKRTKFKTPKVESTGTGGGFKLFCAGVGVEHTDANDASRPIKVSEYERCLENGVREIVEIKIGYDGIVLANSKAAPEVDLTRRDLFLALAKHVPDPADPESGKLVPNPYKTWKDVKSSLPDVEIEVLGPPPTSGTRDAFVELAMEKGCKSFNWIKDLKKQDKNRYKAICHGLREDGAFIEAGENDNLIVQKLEANHDALGIFGFSFLDQNTDVIRGQKIDGVAPELETIADGSYPVSRPLFVYIKKAHVGKIPGIEEFVKEYTAERAWGPEGYLADKGLIPLPDDERKAMWADANAMRPMAPPAAH
jgi:phosphate transport system substrate-binding protein